MKEKEGEHFPRETRVKPQSKFQITAPGTAPEVIALLRLSEREGAYGSLSEKARRILEMRYVEGLTMSQIGDVLGISKQAVSQSLKYTPESIYNRMVRDVITYKTDINFKEILKTYSAYRVYLDKKKKGGG